MVRLAKTSRPLVVVSNQRGVSRGLVSPSTLLAIETRIQEALAVHGCRVEAFRYCLHDIIDGCECRKPRPGLLLSAARDLHLDLVHSWMIGDSEADVEAGRSAGCRTILLTMETSGPEHTIRSLAEAADVVSA